MGLIRGTRKRGPTVGLPWTGNSGRERHDGGSMSNPNAWLILAGLHSFVFAVFHTAFWRLFSWRSQLPRLTPVNRGILQVLNLCLTYFFAAFGLLVLMYRSELLMSPFGRTFLAVMSLFWVIRLVLQLVFFSWRHWASVLLSVLFAIGAILHAVPLGYMR